MTIVPASGGFVFPRNSEEAHFQEKALIKGIMCAANAISLPSRVLSEALEIFYNTPPIDYPIQDKVTEAKNTLIKDFGILTGNVSTNIPEQVSILWNQTLNKLKIAKAEIKEKWLKKYGIPKEDTDYFFDSVGHNLGYLGIWGTNKLAIRLAKAVKKPRLSFAEDYLKSAEEFSRVKEFNGVLKKDLVIVRYHNETSVASKSWKWWTSTRVANRCDTITKIKDRLALLDAFGDKTHVSVARIPSGTRIQLLHGRSKPQFCPSNTKTGSMAEFRPGGGYQIRVKDFKESWIQKTCSLSDPSICFTSPRQGFKVNTPLSSAVAFLPLYLHKKPLVNREKLKFQDPSSARLEPSSKTETTLFSSQTKKDTLPSIFEKEAKEKETASKKEILKKPKQEVLSLPLPPITVDVSPSLVQPKESSLQVSTNIGKQATAGLQIEPFNSKPLTTVGNLNIFENRQGTVGIGFDSRSKKPQLQFSKIIPKIGQVGININFKKPLHSDISVQAPVPVAGIPLMLSFNGRLKRLADSKITISLGLPLVDNLLNLMGIRIPSIKIASISVRKVCKIAKKAFKGIGKVLGFWKFRGKYAVVTPPLPPIKSPLEKEIDLYEQILKTLQNSIDEHMKAANDHIKFIQDNPQGYFSIEFAFPSDKMLKEFDTLLQELEATIKEKDVEQKLSFSLMESESAHELDDIFNIFPDNFTFSLTFDLEKNVQDLENSANNLKKSVEAYTASTAQIKDARINLSQINQDLQQSNATMTANTASLSQLIQETAQIKQTLEINQNALVEKLRGKLNPNKAQELRLLLKP